MTGPHPDTGANGVQAPDPRQLGAYFALTEILGYPRVRNYVGSWKEWGDREDLPVEVPKRN